MMNEQGDPVLNMNTHWRSRDLYKAWFMNVYAMTELQMIMAKEITEIMGEVVKIGRYVDVSDSLHLYGSYFHEIEPEIEKMMTTSVDGRAWPVSHPAFQMMTEEARKNLEMNPDFYVQEKQ